MMLTQKQLTALMTCQVTCRHHLDLGTRQAHQAAAIELRKHFRYGREADLDVKLILM